MKKVYFLILSIIVLRIILIGQESFHIDMGSLQAWAWKLTQVGPGKFYEKGYFADYFPGYLYILWFLGKTFSLANSLGALTTVGFEHYLKFFTNLFDIGSAFLIYKIVSKKDKIWGGLSALFYLLNPALIFNSSVWGQVDGVLIFFTILCFYSLLEINKYFLWCIFSAITFIVKPQGLPALFLTGIYFLKKADLKKYIFLLIAPLTAIVFSAPFFPNDPILGLFHLFQKSSGVYPYTSMFAYNLWSLAGWWVSDQVKFWGLTYETIGIILFFITLASLAIPLLLKKNPRKEVYYLGASLALFSFYMFLTRMHERYFIYCLPFLLIYATLGKSIKLIVAYFLLAIVHFFDIWYVYIYYNFVYSNPHYQTPLLYNFLGQNYNFFSLLNLAFLVVLMAVYFKTIFKNEN